MVATKLKFSLAPKGRLKALTPSQDKWRIAEKLHSWQRWILSWLIWSCSTNMLEKHCRICLLVQGGFLIIRCFVTDCCVSQGTGVTAARLMPTAQQAKHHSSSHSHLPAPSCCNNVNEEPCVCGTAQHRHTWHEGQWTADSLLKTSWVHSKMVTAYAKIGLVLSNKEKWWCWIKPSYF